MNVWTQENGYQEFVAEDCTVTLSPRPPYCDRGRFMASLDVTNWHVLHVDVQDGFPRYYFDEERAKLEIEAWLKIRKQI